MSSPALPVPMPEELRVVDDDIKEYLVYRGFLRTLNALEGDRREDRLREFDVQKVVDEIFGYVRDFDVQGLIVLWSFLETRLASAADLHSSRALQQMKTSLFRYYVVSACARDRRDRALDFLAHYTCDGPGAASLIPAAMRGEWDAGWRQWFALPYLKEPDKDPQYRLYFEREWQASFRASLHNLLSLVLAACPAPRLLLAAHRHEEEEHRLRREVERVRAEVSEREARERELRQAVRTMGTTVSKLAAAIKEWSEREGRSMALLPVVRGASLFLDADSDAPEQQGQRREQHDHKQHGGEEHEEECRVRKERLHEAAASMQAALDQLHHDSAVHEGPQAEASAPPASLAQGAEDLSLRIEEWLALLVQQRSRLGLGSPEMDPELYMFLLLVRSGVGARVAARWTGVEQDKATQHAKAERAAGEPGLPLRWLVETILRDFPDYTIQQIRRSTRASFGQVVQIAERAGLRHILCPNFARMWPPHLPLPFPTLLAPSPLPAFPGGLFVPPQLLGLPPVYFPPPLAPTAAMMVPLQPPSLALAPLHPAVGPSFMPPAGPRALEPLGGSSWPTASERAGAAPTSLSLALGDDDLLSPTPPPPSHPPHHHHHPQASAPAGPPSAARLSSAHPSVVELPSHTSDPPPPPPPSGPMDGQQRITPQPQRVGVGAPSAAAGPAAAGTAVVGGSGGWDGELVAAWHAHVAREGAAHASQLQ